MIRRPYLIAVLLVLAGCASSPDEPERNAMATSLQVDTDSVGHEVVRAVPPESAMERFTLVDRAGRQVAYVAFTDTAWGGLLFLDDRLAGTLSKRDARAFYSCRGYVTATRHNWSYEALDWVAALEAAAVPADAVTLDFSGKSTMQSIKEVVSNPVLSDVKSIVGMGSNPFSIFSTLSSARSNMVEREKFQKALEGLSGLRPGDTEDKVARIIRPEDLAFTSDGMVMAYPRFSLDFYINDGQIKVIQQPSFHRLSRLHAAIFYVPGLSWERCTPQQWREALAEGWKPPAPEEDEGGFFTTAKKKEDGR